MFKWETGPESAARMVWVYAQRARRATMKREDYPSVDYFIEKERLAEIALNLINEKVRESRRLND